MRTRLLLLLLLASAALVPLACRTLERQAPADGATAAAERIRRDVAWLADDARDGRGLGTAGLDSAAEWISRRLAELGTIPLATDTSRAACRVPTAPAECRMYVQRFIARSAAMAHAGRTDGVAAQNVVAMIRGSDPVLRGEYVVIGAHYDHLGREPGSSMDPGAGSAIRNGADDNASGTAAVLELARQLAARAPRRSVIVAAFSGEEAGLLGSQWFVEHSPVALDGIAAMLNFDMVGRLRNEKLIVYGTGTATELSAILDSANATERLAISKVPDGFGPSDHASFYGKGIPVLHFFTDLHDDYHRATDDAEAIDAAGTARVAAVAERVVREIADRPARLVPVRLAAPAPAGGSRTGSDVYLGSIPDMSAASQPGLRLSGVRAGSPADAGGLKAGDLIVELGGVPVKDLYSYTDALYSRRAGDVVEIAYVRDGARRTARVTLGKRGQ